MKSDLITTIQQLGFTEYESKAYLALLEQAPLSGYAVARASGVPRSKIYEVLENMAERGAIIASNSDPIQYAPLPPQQLIAQTRHRQQTLLDEAETALEGFQSHTATRDLIWDIRGREMILSQVIEIINRSEESILMQLWSEDAHLVGDALQQAAERGVDIYIVGYGPINLPFAHIYDHDLVDDVTRGVGGRWIILCSDTSEIIAGIVSLGEDSRAAWTSHPGLVIPINEQIKHDLYILDMLDSHREILEATYGPGLVALREKYGKPATYAHLLPMLRDIPD